MRHAAPVAMRKYESALIAQSVLAETGSFACSVLGLSVASRRGLFAFFDVWAMFDNASLVKLVTCW